MELHTPLSMVLMVNPGIQHNSASNDRGIAKSDLWLYGKCGIKIDDIYKVASYGPLRCNEVS
jgi:hypothetical protein